MKKSLSLIAASLRPMTTTPPLILSRELFRVVVEEIEERRAVAEQKLKQLTSVITVSSLLTWNRN